jgi:hypothetical protein
MCFIDPSPYRRQWKPIGASAGRGKVTSERWLGETAIFPDDLILRHWMVDGAVRCVPLSGFPSPAKAQSGKLREVPGTWWDRLALAGNFWRATCPVCAIAEMRRA